MSVQFTIDGLEELRQALLKLPAVLADKAAGRVAFRTALAAQKIRDSYPVRTGNLRNGVKTSVDTSGVSVVGVVKNTAKIAWMYENGTQARHTDTGANRGQMFSAGPPGHVFIPIVAQERRAMYGDLAEIVAGEGLEVSGDASR